MKYSKVFFLTLISLMLCSLSLHAATTDPLDYLCFTAEQANSTVALNKKFYPGAISLQYSTDKKSWSAYTVGNKITLSNIGDKVYFRATDTNTTMSFDDGSNRYYFEMTGLIAGSGNIMSLLDKTCQQTTLPKYAFCYLFTNCTSLVSAPKLPATTLAEWCYGFMFGDCTSLVNAPVLPATTLANKCYYFMFAGCSSLKNAPELPATILADDCYYLMFEDCSSLEIAPELPALTLADNCYRGMFRGCHSLKNAPELPATQLEEDCYLGMFDNCTSLISAPELPATKLVFECYYDMFKDCTSLQTAPKLPVTTLAYGCYYGMFSGCTSLATAPELPATKLTNKCYYRMFYGCTSLNAIEVGFSSWPTAQEALTDWVNGVAAKGTFTAPCELPDKRGTSYIPEGWDKAGCEQEEDPLDYLCFTAEQAGSTVGLTYRGSPSEISLEYSTDKKSWSAYTIDNKVALSNVGDNVYFRATNINSTFSKNDQICYYFVMSGKIAASGNIMSLLDKSCQQTTLPEYAFCDLFIGCTSLVSAPKLPAKKLVTGCYEYMFLACSSLVSAPELPATTLADFCYTSMFSGCTSLVNAPELPAMTLARDCYWNMFERCTSLVSAPKLPATTLAEWCYVGMFRYCNNLTSAPKLPITKLAAWCYADMFYGCTSLVNAPALPATTLMDFCYSSMFYDCTSLAYAPELPATTLAERCYSQMFSGCVSLVNAPQLPATTLAKSCYADMFSRCTSLEKIQVAFSSWPTEEGALSNWVNGVAAKGTFTAPCELPDKRGTSYIPEGWNKEGECKEEFTLTITATEGGSATGSGTYEKGTSVTISATATDPCYTFVQWSDEVTENPRNIIVTQDSSLTAIFEAKTNPTLPVVERYSWLLMLNMKAIHEMGYDFNEDAVRWYRVQGTPDDVNQPLWDDEFVCNGYSLTIDQNLAGTGSYYAVVDRLSVQAKSEELCEGKMRSEVITVTNPIPIIPKVSLSPTLVEANAPLHVSGLVPQETTLIRIFSATGQLIQEYRSQQQSEYTINAFSHPGCYYMHIENAQQITTLPYIVK